MNKVFVTGADGMLGSSICRELLKQGYSVKAMCFPGRNTNTLSDLALEIVLGDVSDKDFLLREMNDCNSVIHIAALTRVWPRRLPVLNRVNIDGTKNVMEVVEELNLERMIHIGSASSFAHGTKDNPGDESNPFIGWKFGMDYINSKYLAQQMLLKRFNEKGFPVVIINPTFMIGPYDSGPSSGQMLIAVMKNTLKWYCPGGKNFVCSTDVAKAAVNAISLGVIGQCYIAGNENLEYRDFFYRACKHFQKQFKMKSVPHSLLLSFGFINSAISRITHKTPKLSFGMALLAKENQYFSSEKAKRVLQMPQTPIEKGIEECIGWFKANNYL